MNTRRSWIQNAIEYKTLSITNLCDAAIFDALFQMFFYGLVAEKKKSDK